MAEREALLIKKHTGRWPSTASPPAICRSVARFAILLVHAQVSQECEARCGGVSIRNGSPHPGIIQTTDKQES